MRRFCSALLLLTIALAFRWAAETLAADDGPAVEVDPAGRGTYPWSKLISAGTLETEIKNQVTALTPSMANPAKFSSSVSKTRNAFSLTATMFAVIAGYDGEVRWKASAPGMRDGTARAGFRCKVSTANSFNEARARHKDLSELLSGIRPRLPEALPETDWATVAEFSELMKRIEQANDQNLKPWSADRIEFAAHKDKYLHEAELLTALAQVISYYPEHAGKEDFAGFAATLKEAALEMVQAVKADNFEEAQAGHKKATRACADCHAVYRGL